MFRNNVSESNIPSLVTNHTNYNGAHTNLINQDYIVHNNDAEIELIRINSPVYDDQSDSDEHETSLNTASSFINEARRKKFTTNDYNKKPLYTHPHMQHRRHSFNTTFRPNVIDTTFYEREKENREQVRNHFFNTINDFLEEFENSSDDERPNKIKQNYFNNKDAQYETISVLDQSVYVQEAPMLIYSFKNKNCVPENNENLINSPNKESPNTSTDSNSGKKFNEGALTYERNFFRIPKSFPPVIIPRLPLTYMLPTVTEIIEPSRPSPKVTEIYDEDVDVTRKPINSWVMHSDDSSNSEENNTLETNEENSADESSLNNTRKSVQVQDNTVIVHYQNKSLEYDNENYEIKHNNDDDDDAINKGNAHFYFDEQMGNISPKSTGRSKTNVFVNSYLKYNLKQPNYNDSLNKIDSLRKENFGNYSLKSRDRNSTPNPSRDFSSVNSIPALHLSFNTENDTTEQSWFKRFIKCILCCK